MLPWGENVEYDKLRRRFEKLQAELLQALEARNEECRLRQAAERRYAELLRSDREEAIQQRIEGLHDRLKDIARDAQFHAVRADAAERLIIEHNQGCEAACGRNNELNAKAFGCEAYLSRDMQCPNCPMDDLIEMTALETGA